MLGPCTTHSPLNEPNRNQHVFSSCTGEQPSSRNFLSPLIFVRLFRLPESLDTSDPTSCTRSSRMATAFEGEFLNYSTTS